MLGIGELTLILLVIVVVLSIKRLPDLVRSAGKAARILKSEKRALKEQEAPQAAPPGPGTGPGTGPGAANDDARPSPRVIRGETTERRDL
ncbi:MULTISPECIES: twin-arginine translocase TatA/TatE family subunit [unclassified Streptomyces]|uniref:twin-arginine translocase TatA/TatE family subunit n=1 Tax=unclassified Streptomyces TaxID=2593676 RepID=UPI0015879319|nr:MULTISPECIES: twin-arginine translocase TatA/TatE family subunit [unclassified Streptomyces]NUV71562.1 Sec-independent protein translocase TatA [Streptomyces sp. CAI-121]NUW00044.1 Sec-independent protein translocase TatA [Streptomyces sp. CAI 127]NUW17766.1 Sec-independent protein translocase TatA [Streptomyces sp. CAI-68]